MNSKTSRERRRVCILHTGGTIGMRRGDRGYETARGFLDQQMEEMPEFERPEMPLYEIVESKVLLDSSHMRSTDWQGIGNALRSRFDDFDGFIVLHGTDTMAYSASVLSYMFENLSKPIIFTGSQIPLVEIRSDARENLITSMLIAADETVNEVCIYFGEQLLRGNRATKISVSGFRAFASPNFPILGLARVQLQIKRDLLLPQPDGQTRVLGVANPQVADLRLFPGITAETVHRILQPPLQGAVLHTYGSGNAPDTPTFLEALRKATQRGVVIVNCTQCLEGSVSMKSYAAGHGLLDAGVISGYDMTPEAALTKLYFLLSQDLSPEEVKRQMQLSLRGELTLP